MKVVIIGGVAGGASAAARLRRLDEKAEITIYEKSGFVSYANCGLPYFIGEVIEDKNNLTLQNPHSFKNRFNIDVKVNHEVLSIDKTNKKVRVKNLVTDEEFEDSYDKLIIAVGAKPIKPDLEGIDSKKIYTLRNVEDTKRIKNEFKDLHNIAIVGGGFIGVELAENLRKLNKEVTIIDKADQVLGQIDEDMISFVHKELTDYGIKLMLGRGIASFKEEDDQVIVNLDTNESLKVEAVILAIGVSPESKLAKDAGLKLGVKDAILVDETMSTSDSDIYAVGDVVAIKNIITNDLITIPLAGPANKEGRIASNNIVGLTSTYKGSLGTNILKVFEMSVASSGINEKIAKANNYKYAKIIISPASHASYYPGGKAMTIKVLFNPDNEMIYGAEIVGYDGVDKRIDVLATAMFAKMKISDLKDLDLAYAPPFSSAKDPINMLGFVADNVIHGIVKHFYVEDIEELNKRTDVILLDTRTTGEYVKGHAEGFELNIPVDELRDRLDELDKNKKIYVMCQSGLRSYIATRILKANGYDCYNFAGGYRFYNSVKNNEFNKNCKTDCGI